MHMKETMKLLDTIPKVDQNINSASNSNIKQNNKLILSAFGKEKRYSHPSSIVNLMTVNMSKIDSTDNKTSNCTKQGIVHSNSSSSFVIVYPDTEKNNLNNKNFNQKLLNSRVRQQISKYEEILK